MLSLIRRIRVLTMDSGYIGWAARIKLIHEIPMDNKPFSVTNSLDSRPLVNAMILIIAIAMILVGCISDKQTPQAVESSSLLPKPDPLPDWLREVRPISSSVITQEQYKIVITPEDIAVYYEENFKGKQQASELNEDSGDINEAIIKILRRKKLEEAYSLWINDLKSNYKIEINNTQLEKISGAEKFSEKDLQLDAPPNQIQ